MQMAKSLAYVGEPIWSYTTCKFWLSIEALLMIVLTKLLPWVLYNQEVLIIAPWGAIDIISFSPNNLEYP